MQQTDPTHKRSENADWITVKQTMARAAMDITREGRYIFSPSRSYGLTFFHRRKRHTIHNL